VSGDRSASPHWFARLRGCLAMCIHGWPPEQRERKDQASGKRHRGHGKSPPLDECFGGWSRRTHPPEELQMSLFSSRTAQPPPSGRHTSSPPRSMAGGPVAARMMNGARAIYLCLSALYAIVRGFFFKRFPPRAFRVTDAVV
jgi:hypothetical protein